MKGITLFVSAAVAACAGAGPIWSPVAVIRNDYGELNSNYVITQTFSQVGLLSGFTSGVTDFDAYAPATQLHDTDSKFNDWFSTGTGFVAGGFVDFDLGAAMDLARAAIWNEDGAGIDMVNIYTSTDPSFGSSTFVGQFALTNNPVGVDYGADVLDLIDSHARYVRLEILSIPADSQWPGGVSLGEIAFEQRIVQMIPLPSAAALGAAGVLGLGCRRRRGSL